ncbi:CatB-related O-acetyltransferase [Aliidiomarina quisquiliarum]|uniref:CatB-related O-acetyltransferase n=1 Tax=Aliidiomarina quisquiliarum TaxID=2938947 RepID=UPI00208E0E7B|nr:CatB-related O-acetyltransferase [Aliidiomarina quisquiliarum]MCO4319941.1 CatB-related O-acetyltransferase [Aliidiomarina quisquiliarum]
MKFKKDGPVISESARVNSVEFGICTFLDERVRATESVIGDYSYLMHDSEVIYTEIGKYCAIAPFVRINPSTHPYWRPAMANFTYRSKDYGICENDQPLFDFRKSQRVTIGNDVWIGQGALIMPDIIIGDGAIIGGNAVVTRNVPPYAIVGGVPANLIRMRFDESVVESLLRIRWWDWPDSIMRERIQDLREESIERFCKKYDENY